MQVQLAVSVEHLNQVGEARRAASRIAREAGFSERDQADVALVATELATNLAKHAQRGLLLLQPWLDAAQPLVELLAIDSGPGMRDVEACLRDGYSTAGSPGTGLGAVRRSAREFDLHSIAGKGTVLLARVGGGDRSAASASSRHEWGVVCMPMQGESVCGDGWHVSASDGELCLMVADGLGHGASAHEAVSAAEKVFESEAAFGPKAFLERAHVALAATRGAAIAAAAISAERAHLRFAGVGNLSATLWSPSGTQGLVSHHGTVGAHMRRVQEFVHEWRADTVLLLHTDGLQSRWSADEYPGLIRRHPAVIAAVLFRDFQRGRDDVTVVAVKMRR